MKTSSLIVGLLLGAAFAAAPAIAKTTLTKGKRICETAAKGQEPAPKSVRVDDDQTRATDATIVYTLRVKNADDSSTKLTCTVDREAETHTLAAAP